MRRKAVQTISICILLVTFCVMFASCQKHDDVAINYGYYYCSSSSDASDLSAMDTSVWMYFGADKTWQSSDGYHGTYEINGSAVIARQNSYTSYMRCAYSSGVMSVAETSLYLVQNSAADRRVDTSTSDFKAISTVDELLAIDDSATAAGKSYYLANDIDFAHYISTASADGSISYTAHEPIDPLFSKVEYSFSGILDGKGHTISNIEIAADPNDNYTVGLFSDIDGGVIRNLNVEHIYVECTNGSARPQGLLAGLITNALISDVKIVGKIDYYVTGSYTAGTCCIGGVCGEMRDSSIVRTEVTAEDAESGIVTATDGYYFYNMRYAQMYGGGIVGVAYGECKFDECYFGGTVHFEQSVGDVSSTSSTQFTLQNAIGGILGAYKLEQGAQNSLTMSNCSTDSDITFDVTNALSINTMQLNSYVGGVVGTAENDIDNVLTVFNCSFLGKITGNMLTYGQSINGEIGGISGNLSTTVSHCYAAGNISVLQRIQDGATNKYATLNVSGLCYNASLDGCFVSGSINGEMSVNLDSSYKKENCALNVLVASAEAMTACGYSSDLVLSGKFVFRDQPNSIVGDYTEVRASATNNDLAHADPMSMAQLSSLYTLRTQYSMGYMPYRNVVDVLANPSRAWSLRDGALPALYWRT